MNKSTFAGICLCLFVVAAANLYAVPPAYKGDMGNAEEPALRVVKWPWLGFRKMVVRTHEGLRDGIQHHPPAAIYEGAKGAVHGGGVLGHHTGQGLIYAELPPKESLYRKADYESETRIYLEERFVPQQEADAVADEAEVEVQESAEGEMEEDPGPPLLTLKVRQSDVEKAQRVYVPLRASYRDRRIQSGGNLLKLAR